ncbi:hypothetical protein ES702_01043 [subsurface metagenome]
MKLPFDFDGFESPHYTMVPDEIFDKLLPCLNPSELKVLLYLVRRTFGFKKDKDSISLTQISNGIRTRTGKVIDTGTGLSRPAIIKALKVLEENNIILAHRSRNYKGEKQTNIYSLNVIHRVVKKFNYGSKEYLPRVVKKFNLQETVIQETNNVNVSYQSPKKAQYQVDGLVLEMEEVLQDKHSNKFYKKIAQRCPPQMIYTALSQIQDMNNRRQIKKSKAALFTGLIKKMAQEAHLELNLKAK